MRSDKFLGFMISSHGMDPIPAYLSDDILYADLKEADRVKKGRTILSYMRGSDIRDPSPCLSYDV